MALTDMVLMPGADYQAICDAVRAKTGSTELLKSGEIPAAIENCGMKLYTFKGESKNGKAVVGLPAEIADEQGFDMNVMCAILSDNMTHDSPQWTLCAVTNYNYCQTGEWSFNAQYFGEAGIENELCGQGSNRFRFDSESLIWDFDPELIVSDCDYELRIIVKG